MHEMKSTCRYHLSEL